MQPRQQSRVRAIVWCSGVIGSSGTLLGWCLHGSGSVALVGGVTTTGSTSSTQSYRTWGPYGAMLIVALMSVFALNIGCAGAAPESIACNHHNRQHVI
jgi:hypothetical protein